MTSISSMTGIVVQFSPLVVDSLEKFLARLEFSFIVVKQHQTFRMFLLESEVKETNEIELIRPLIN